MRKHILTLGHDSLIYGVGSVALRLSGIITLPIYARVFAPDQLANLELATAAFSLLFGVMDLGLTSAFVRSYFDYGDDDPEGVNERHVIVSTAFSVILTVTALVAVALIAFRQFVGHVIFVHPGETRLVVLVGLMLPPAMVTSVTCQLMRVRRERRAFVISAAIGSVMTIAVGPLLILVFHAGIQAVLIGQLAGSVASAVYGAWVIRRWLQPRFSKQRLVEMLKYGLPFLPTAAAFWAVALVDRFMIEHLSNLDQLGQYAVANRVTVLIPLVLLGFSTAYSPFILRLYSEDRDLERIVRGRTLTYVTVGIAFVGVALSLFAREMIEVIAPSYRVAFKAVGLLLIGIGSYGLCSVLGAGMSLTRKTYWNMLFASIGAAVNIGLNYILIPHDGMVGAAAATAVGYVVIASLYYANAQRIYRTPYELKKILGTVALALPAGALGVLTYPNLATALVIKGAVLIAFPVALIAVGIITIPRAPGVPQSGRWPPLASVLRQIRALRG
jgi:O-antigen/teichoic acid export membrane protein